MKVAHSGCNIVPQCSLSGRIGSAGAETTWSVQNLNNPQKLQQLLEQYPILVQALQSGGLR